MMKPHAMRLLMSIASGWCACQPSLAGPIPDNDFDWATIGDPGNPAYSGDAGGWGAGRGSVPYTYRISRLEITTGQWMEFVNTFSTQSDDLSTFADPVFWGATVDTTYTGPGRRWRLGGHPDAGRLPVGGISWREAAQYCNWLHNGKSEDLGAIAGGAYDTSTWGEGPGGTFTDAWTHEPAAKFWIPTLDEWMKAVHYDPYRYGPGEPGWWVYPHRSDEPPVYAPPGEGGESNAAFTLPDWGEWAIPVGSYPHVQSPWGLLDASGSAGEWLEEVLWPHEPTDRAWEQSVAGGGYYLTELNDRVSVWSGGTPWVGGSSRGLRLASAIPSPGVLTLLSAALGISFRRRSR